MPGAPGNEGCARVSIGTAPTRNWCTLGEMQRCSRAPRHQLVQQACKAAVVQSSSCAKQQVLAGLGRLWARFHTQPARGAPWGHVLILYSLGAEGAEHCSQLSPW